jgi:endonuclease/exonuclease/phosphatase family metal-dependent hydrolase
MRGSRPVSLVFLVLLGVAAACSDSPPSPVPVFSAPRDAGAREEAAAAEAGPARPRDAGRGATVRIMAANTSSGSSSTYDPGEGIRMFQGLHPDVALIQELNYRSGSEADLAGFVTTAFGEGFSIYREPGMQIPNGIVSRWPIVASGSWTDPEVDNRGFAYAKIAVPGTHPLWAVSVHLLTSNAGDRAREAAALTSELSAVVAPGDYVVVGGDLNTDSRTEACITTFDAILHTAGPHPADQSGNETTNATRGKIYDWVLGNDALAARQVPTVIGATTLPAGLVFDSRVFSPIEDVAPVLKEDSAATNMQHMPVIKDFALED